ncbi:MAG: endonuclease domain-containing protein [Gammaproteobacteria bacterium]
MRGPGAAEEFYRGGRCLWSRLRGRRLDGVKFRRQQVLGPYVVDFLCLEPKLVIEVDGGQHAEQVSNDLRRTEYLKVSGYRVIRFWNHEVLGDPDAVLESIRAALFEIPSPPPSPGWERELTEYPWILPRSKKS